jgi:hypothetical protein
MALLDSITADEFSTWLTPPEALQAIRSVMIVYQGCPAIVNLLRHGVVRAAGKQYYRRRGNVDEETGEFVVVPLKYWEAQWASNWQSAFWTSGQVEFEPKVDSRYEARLTYGFLGLRFESKVVSELAPGSATIARRSDHVAAIQATAARRSGAQNDPEGRVAGTENRSPATALVNLDNLPNKGGRPSADFWLDMSLEIANLMSLGDFKPRTQAEVVDAMQRWIIDHGYDGGLTRTK